MTYTHAEELGLQSGKPHLNNHLSDNLGNGVEKTLNSYGGTHLGSNVIGGSTNGIRPTWAILGSIVIDQNQRHKRNRTLIGNWFVRHYHPSRYRNENCFFKGA